MIGIDVAQKSKYLLENCLCNHEDLMMNRRSMKFESARDICHVFCLQNLRANFRKVISKIAPSSNLAMVEPNPKQDWKPF